MLDIKKKKKQKNAQKSGKTKKGKNMKYSL